MRWRWDNDAANYRCCLCLHVNTGSVLLGMFHMTFNLMALLMLIGMMMVDPGVVQQNAGVEGSVEVNSSTGDKISDFHGRKWTNDDKCLAALMHLCSFLIASLLVSGIKKGNPNYVIPFFFMQLFDFVLSFTAGFAFLSYPRDIKVWIAAQHDLPYREELLEQSADHLLLGIFIAFVAVLTVKYYLMNMVWSSYKFLELQRRNQTPQRSEPLDEEASDSEVIAMVNPPKYEDAFVANENIVKMPPPPAYSAQA